MNTPKKNIIWLASYPKSGNTWIRLFLHHILAGNIDQKGIPILQDIPIVSNRNLIDQYLGVNSADLTSEEILDYRPSVYRVLSSESDDVKILKAHDAFEKTPNGDYIFPPDITHAVIYIVRNPLDLVVSYAYHTGKSIQTIINQLNDPEFKISVNITELKPQITQHLGTWSQHVLSWTKQRLFPVILIKYEQLLAESPEVLRDMLDKLGIHFGEDEFSNALKSTDFSYLQEQEQTYGFQEKPLHADSFFREGKKNIYKQHLTEEQISSVINNHKDIMSNLGYLSDLK